MPDYRIKQETKREILERVKQGVGVPQLSREHGVSDKTIYSWIRKQAEGSTGDLRELGKLKRENKALLELVGKLTLQLSRGEKSRPG